VRRSAKLPVQLWAMETVALRSARKCRYVQPSELLSVPSVVVKEM
jgi:hypothetical protein